MKKKVIVAMSGGVDSTVSAYLLSKQNYECIGVYLKLFDNNANQSYIKIDDPTILYNSSVNISEKNYDYNNDLNSMYNTIQVERIAKLLNIPLYTYDVSDIFKKKVITRFVKSYQQGETPNPCISCNKYIKFNLLYDIAKQHNADFIATGHYAIFNFDKQKNEFVLRKGKDKKKDQSYVLYTISKAHLSKTIFPLGNYLKSDVREIARYQGFENYDKKDSQDICFVSNGDYAEFITKFTNKPPCIGDFIDLNGKSLGKHQGLIKYTIGQRKGLGISLNRPMFVHSKNIKKNTITLCDDNQLYSNCLSTRGFHWVKNIDYLLHSSHSFRAKAKIRYNQSEEWSNVIVESKNIVHLLFDNPQRAIAKGQSAVLYDDDVVFGGGIIV